jgi:hypothetical protein
VVTSVPNGALAAGNSRVTDGIELMFFSTSSNFYLFIFIHIVLQTHIIIGQLFSLFVGVRLQPLQLGCGEPHAEELEGAGKLTARMGATCVSVCVCMCECVCVYVCMCVCVCVFVCIKLTARMGTP